MSEGNGHTPEGKFQLVLDYDPATGVMNLGGNVQNLDVILNMLAQATRFVDVQYRINAAVQAQEELKKRQAEFARVQSLLRK